MLKETGTIQVQLKIDVPLDYLIALLNAGALFNGFMSEKAKELVISLAHKIRQDPAFFATLPDEFRAPVRGILEATAFMAMGKSLEDEG